MRIPYRHRLRHSLQSPPFRKGGHSLPPSMDTMEKRAGPDGGILIVDDHQPTVKLLVDLLSSAAPGVAIRTARSAQEALVLYRAMAPAVVVMDIGLPGANGIEAAREIKALLPAVGIVMHSNHDSAIYREKSAAIGADAFVSKARTHDELVPAVAMLLAPR